VVKFAGLIVKVALEVTVNASLNALPVNIVFVDIIAILYSC
jgi:hypothetical protein